MTAFFQKLRKLPWIWLLIAVFFCKELLWSYLTPPWQAPDEIAHYGYVESLFYEHRFPVLGKTVLSERVQAIGPVDPAKEIDYYKGSLALNWIAQHPPLYYLGLEPLYALLPQDDPLLCIFILRLVSIIMASVTLFYAKKTLDQLLPDGPSNPGGIVTKTVLVGIAFMPMFSSISALMNNDNLVFMLSSILIYLSVLNFDERTHRLSLQTGIVLGLLALTKVTALPLYVSIFTIEIVKHLRMRKTRKDFAHFVRHQLIIFGSAFAIAAWWYVRNIALYHMLFPDIGAYAAKNPALLAAYPNLVKIFPEASGVLALPNATVWGFFFGAGFLGEYYKNIWGAFGQFFFRLFTWQYAVVGLLTLASAAGFTKFAAESFQKKNRKHLWKKILGWKGWTMLLPIVFVSAALSYELFQIFRERGFLGALQGRYLFSALIPFMYFFVRGLAHLVSQKNLSTAMKIIMTFFVFSGFVTIMFRIIPEFY